MVGLEPKGFEEVKLFDITVTIILPLNVEAIGGHSECEGCGSDLFEVSVAISRLMLWVGGTLK